MSSKAPFTSRTSATGGRKGAAIMLAVATSIRLTGVSGSARTMRGKRASICRKSETFWKPPATRTTSSRVPPARASFTTLSCFSADSVSLGAQGVFTSTRPCTMRTFWKRSQLPQPGAESVFCCVVSPGKMRAKFHFPPGGRSSTTTGRTSTTSSSTTCFERKGRSE